MSDEISAELFAALAISAVEDPETFGRAAVDIAVNLCTTEKLHEAQQWANSMLDEPSLPEFAAEQLRAILEYIQQEG